MHPASAEATDVWSYDFVADRTHDGAWGCYVAVAALQNVLRAPLWRSKRGESIRSDRVI